MVSNPITPLVRAHLRHLLWASRESIEHFYTPAMQRLFSMFPGGTAGLALIALRVCVLSSLWMTVAPSGAFSFTWWHVALSLVCLSLAVGAFTPFVCTVSFILELWVIWYRTPAADQIFISALLTVVLGCLGPGAFSIDARLFGRRRIIVDGD
jgi:hypothetical protein